MADNYIEKRMEELRSGAASPSYSPRNLDALLAAAARSAAIGTAVEPARETANELAANVTDPALKVHPLQLEAIARVNTKIQGACSVKCLADGSGTPLGDGAFIVVQTPDSQAPHLEFELGMRAEAMILKATELGLCAEVLLDIDFEASKKAWADALEGAQKENSDSPAIPVLALQIHRRK